MLPWLLQCPEFTQNVCISFCEYIFMKSKCFESLQGIRAATEKTRKRTSSTALESGEHRGVSVNPGGGQHVAFTVMHHLGNQTFAVVFFKSHHIHRPKKQTQ